LSSRKKREINNKQSEHDNKQQYQDNKQTSKHKYSKPKEEDNNTSQQTPKSTNGDKFNLSDEEWNILTLEMKIKFVNWRAEERQQAKNNKKGKTSNKNAKETVLQVAETDDKDEPFQSIFKVPQRRNCNAKMTVVKRAKIQDRTPGNQGFFAKDAGDTVKNIIHGKLVRGEHYHDPDDVT